MRWFRKKTVENSQNLSQTTPARSDSVGKRDHPYRTVGQISSMLRYSDADLRSGRFRIKLYRFLADNVPAVSACIWTWSRLAAASGAFQIVDADGEQSGAAAQRHIEFLSDRLGVNSAGHMVSQSTFLTELFTSMFRDGVFHGVLTVKKDSSGIDRFVTLDSADLSLENSDGQSKLYLEGDLGRVNLNRPDYYFIPLTSGPNTPLGKSILTAVPFVSYIEQQLVDDMRRASHNSGFNRLHVSITPPERLAGEADSAYMTRINGYFDSTVNMIKTCDIDDNPVTWDNVKIDHVGPKNYRGITNAWFFNHRAMIEDICAGTNLAPFLLGYSYGATTTWSGFKFDLVMRQVQSVQAEVAQFLEWIGNIELALAGHKACCRFVFDNTLTYQANDKSSVETNQVANLLKLFEAGLIDEKTARTKAGKLI